MMIHGNNQENEVIAPSHALLISSITTRKLVFEEAIRSLGFHSLNIVIKSVLKHLVSTLSSSIMK